MADMSDAKIPLPMFLKMLTNNNIPPSKAMTIAGKIYKTHNTPKQLGLLTDYTLESAGVDKDVRKLVLAAVRKEGYKQKPTNNGGGSNNVASTSKSSKKTNTNPRRKRKRDDDLNELLPDRPLQENDHYGSLEFNETLDEEAIKPKSTVINRAPLMMAWAFVVAERLGFQREEALSIGMSPQCRALNRPKRLCGTAHVPATLNLRFQASVYTEMNAITKGVSLGIYSDSKQRGVEASCTGSQPYVELMGRRPLYQTASSQWRALSSGNPVAPTSAFSYITRALRQTAPHIVGALRLLATSYSPAELNQKGFSLYAEFRPKADGWGQRGEVCCSTILGLRKPASQTDDNAATTSSLDDIVKVEHNNGSRKHEAKPAEQSSAEEPDRKKLRPEYPERDEFDAALDDDTVFDEFEFSSIP